MRRSCLEDLKRLKDLLEDGVLTEEEFADETDSRHSEKFEGAKTEQCH